MKDSFYKKGELFLVVKSCHGEIWNDRLMEALSDFDMEEKAEEWSGGSHLKHIGLLSSIPVRVYSKPIKSKVFIDWLIESKIAKELPVREVDIGFSDDKVELHHDTQPG